MSFIEKLFGSFSDKELKKIRPIADKVLALEPKYQAMADAELQAQTPALKQRLAAGEGLDDILPDAFAVCREASWRVLGMKHFPVQVIGGVVLHRACIAEMSTGEGKTLVATLPVYLNALAGAGVHVVTVNDYLARRDSEWMGKVYKFLGLSVGLIVPGISFEQRKAAYAADVTYGTNNEFGFDYLRDNMVTYKANMVQRDPVVEYRLEGFEMFDAMVDSIREDSVRMLLTIEIRTEQPLKREQVAKPTGDAALPRKGQKAAAGSAPVRSVKIGRNDPCPCGSGRKWKKCTCAQYHPDH